MTSHPCSALDDIVTHAIICTDPEERPDLVKEAIKHLADLAGLSVDIQEYGHVEDDLPVTPLDRIDLAIAQILAALRDPDVTVAPEGAVILLADAVGMRVLPVPRTMMERITRLGNLFVDAIAGVGRRRPELRERLIREMDDQRREFQETVEGWAKYDGPGGPERDWGPVSYPPGLHPEELPPT